MGDITSFEELQCYKEARLLRIEVSKFVRTLPKEEEYRLKDQILRSSRSVTANIAEGYGRHHYQENLQFCRIARGSLTETLEHLITGFDENYLNDDQLNCYRSQIEKAHKLLNGFIGYLKKAKATNSQ